MAAEVCRTLQVRSGGGKVGWGWEGEGNVHSKNRLMHVTRNE